jgi:uncharacterized membrane protein
MLRKINYKFLFATALSFTILNGIDLPPSFSSLESLTGISTKATAKSSGGRSGGGSFSRPSSSGSRSSGSSSGSRSSGSSSGSSGSSYRSSPRYGGGGNTVIIAPGGGTTYSEGYSDGGGTLVMFLVLGFFGLIALILVASWLLSLGGESTDGAIATSADELENDTVTVSKLQVALLAQTKGLQSELSQLSLNVDTDTPEGLSELLQESALILLRNSESWSHVLASSESIHIDNAEAAFNQLSMKERSKFSAETLTNVRGSIRRKAAVIPGLEEDPGAYIVVTLLVGAANDNPLFEDVRSADALKEALEKVASLPADYLMKFELMWSPQVEEDSLTYEELLTEYTNMVQMA